MNQLPTDVLRLVFRHIDIFSDAQHVRRVCKRFRDVINGMAQEKKWDHKNAYDLMSVRLTAIEKTSQKVWEDFFVHMQKAIEPLTLKCIKTINKEIGMVDLLKLIGPSFDLPRTRENWGFEGVDEWMAKEMSKNLPDPNGHRLQTDYYFQNEIQDKRCSSFFISNEGARALAHAITRNEIKAIMICTCSSYSGYLHSRFDEEALFALCNNLPDNALSFARFAGNIGLSKKGEYQEKMNKIKRIILNPDYELDAPGRSDGRGCAAARFFSKI